MSYEIGIMFLLLLQTMTSNNGIRPVTLLLVAIQVLIYTNYFGLNIPTIREVCVSNVAVWYRKQYQRLMLAPFFHVNDIHFYYNIASFLHKGIYLERLLGSPHFLAMLLMFAGLSSAGTLPLNLAGDVLMHGSHYLTQCSVGFSGVLFAMKVVEIHFSPSEHGCFFIFAVPSGCVVWLELVLIHLLLRNASFVGHLSGIFVGLLYTQGPLSTLLGSVVPPDRGTYWERSRFTRTGCATGYRSQGNNQTATATKEDSTPQDAKNPTINQLRDLRAARFEQENAKRRR